jgi:hypothetical protein
VAEAASGLLLAAPAEPEDEHEARGGEESGHGYARLGPDSGEGTGDPRAQAGRDDWRH